VARKVQQRHIDVRIAAIVFVKAIQNMSIHR